MRIDLHHPHLFTADLDASVRFYTEMLGAERVFDGEIAGARNVHLRIGCGLLAFFDQPPRHEGRKVVHHLGLRTDDLDALVAHMRARGYTFRDGIVDVGVIRFVMAMAPDGLLLELFEMRE
jgi:lactoylglutathione lyase/glyoxylase I family protein